MLNRQVILYISNSYQKVLLSIDTGFFTASIAHVAEINPLYGNIIRMREQGVGQADIANSIGKSQASVAAYLKAMKPIIEEFMDNLIY